MYTQKDKYGKIEKKLATYDFKWDHLINTILMKQFILLDFNIRESQRNYWHSNKCFDHRQISWLLRILCSLLVIFFLNRERAGLCFRSKNMSPIPDTKPLLWPRCVHFSQLYRCSLYLWPCKYIQNFHIGPSIGILPIINFKIMRFLEITHRLFSPASHPFHPLPTPLPAQILLYTSTAWC